MSFEVKPKTKNNKRPSLKTLLLEESGRGDDLLISSCGRVKRRQTLIFETKPDEQVNIKEKL